MNRPIIRRGVGWLGVAMLVGVALVGGARGQNYIKPVSAMPDYNGTYQGRPNTGSARYTTLYRDNQDDGRTSGCRGEGCGRHPGVDIAVSSGTSVRTPLAGTVVTSRCDSGWGGLVVIRSQHPGRPWDTVRQVFAHLRAREYSNGVALREGDYVAAGTVIGKSGGRPKHDSCPGYSTGAHLHYQIDKDDSNQNPYYPSSGTLNSRDDNFLVTTRTYNPIVLLQGGYNWSFSQRNNRELWDIFNWSSWGVSDDALWMDGGWDPHVARGGTTNCGLSKPCSSSFAAEADDYRTVYLDLYNVCPSSYGKIYFMTNQEPYWSESKTIGYYPPYTGLYRGHIYAGWHWKWTGIITGLRVDPAEYCDSRSFDPTYYGEIAIKR
ncbi:MAG TPA: M23 family metallopeptidase [Candidatus Doudnabacteria bacterium]|nr:M23 family metallopeptidase [Candidatus Doudnabacteria bacterium]